MVHANERFALALGSTSSALAGRPLSELLERGHTLGAVDDPKQSLEVKFVGEHGATVSISIHETKFELDGETYHVAVGHETELRQMQARLALSDRLASVGTLAAGVAHEMNNPLTYVLANLEFMREQLRGLRASIKPELWQELDDIASEAKSGADRVAQIVRSLKVFSRVDEEKRVAVDLLSVLEVSLRMADNEIRHRAKLTKVYTPVPRVIADEARLVQVFLNLLVNAAQAIPEGRANEYEIRVKTFTNDRGRATVEIQDSGTGIAPEHLPRIFDPFFTTKPQGVGTGLGLSICHGIVTALGGEITVSSTSGQGTTFVVVLPPAPVTVDAGNQQIRISSGRGKSGRILVVDDDAAIGTAVRRMLGSRHAVETTTSGNDALDRLTRGERYDLILCDLMMPVVTGMELHEKVAALVPEQAERMVFMTGGAFTQNARAFLERVTNERVDKPFDAIGLRLLAKTMVDART